MKRAIVNALRRIANAFKRREDFPPPPDMALRSSIVDETDAIRAEEQRELSKLTPDYSNVEVPAVMRKRTATNPRAKPARISPIRKPRG